MEFSTNKTIAPALKLYQFGHAIWLAYHNLIQCAQGRLCVQILTIGIYSGEYPSFNYEIY